MTAQENQAVQVEESVRRWVNDVVVSLNLCPFAGKEIRNDRVRFCVSEATTEERLLGDLQDELLRITKEPGIETTLLIHPGLLRNFAAYNQFLDLADLLLDDLGLEGTLQVASFHPDYQFAGTAYEDAENFTNRSPYPLLHILREASIEAAAEATDTAVIPERNIQLMEQLGSEHMASMLAACKANSRPD